jgi:protease IV
MTEPIATDLPPSEAPAPAAKPAPSAEASSTKKGASTTSPDESPGLSGKTIEALAYAYLADQKSARRWRNFARVGWLLLLSALIWALLSAGNSAPVNTGPHTAVVEIKGEIADGGPGSAVAIVGAVQEAMEDANTKAVILLINSPGGSPVQAGIINDEITRLKALHKIPVYAVVEETCASAAYYIAVAADKIYVDKASIVGSIGVLMDGFGFTGLMGKLGVERRLVTAGDNKGFLDPFSPQTDKQRDYAQAMLNTIHQQFIEVVRKGRGARLKEQSDTFSGLFWSGEQSVKMGLADHLGNLEYVAREVVKAPELMDFSRKENVAERLAKRFGVAVGEGAIRAMTLQGLQLK